jgi:hypothetical protein
MPVLADGCIIPGLIYPQSKLTTTHLKNRAGVSSAQPLLIKYWLMLAVSGSSLPRTTLQRLRQQQLAAAHVLPNNLQDGDRDMERAEVPAAFNQRLSAKYENPSCTALYRASFCLGASVGP